MLTEGVDNFFSFFVLNTGLLQRFELQRLTETRQHTATTVIHKKAPNAKHYFPINFSGLKVFLGLTRNKRKIKCFIATTCG